MDPLGESPWADSAAQASSTQPESSEPTTAKSPTTAATSSNARSSRLTPRRLVAQPTRLQAVEDDPLGPLGGGGGPLAGDVPAEAAPPIPPLKEQQMPVRTTMPSQQQRRPGPADPHRIDDDEDGEGSFARGPRAPPPVQPAQPSPIRTNTLPSVSVEQAAKPMFQITVGDPHKVGDLTSSHIVYAVRTKVRLSWTYYLVEANYR